MSGKKQKTSSPSCPEVLGHTAHDQHEDRVQFQLNINNECKENPGQLSLSLSSRCRTPHQSLMFLRHLKKLNCFFQLDEAVKAQFTQVLKISDIL